MLGVTASCAGQGDGPSQLMGGGGKLLEGKRGWRWWMAKNTIAQWVLDFSNAETPEYSSDPQP